jgi:hypothetical protein
LYLAYVVPPAQPTQRKPDFRAVAEAAVQRGPVAKATAVAGGEILELQIPRIGTSGFLEVQRCYVWRDAEFRTAALNCGGETELRLSE